MSDNDKKVDPEIKEEADAATQDADLDKAPAQTDDAPASNDAAETSNDKPEPVAVEVTHARPSALATVLAVIALFLALAAVAGVFLLYQRGPDALAVANDAALQELSRGQAETERALQQNEQALDTLQQANSATANSVESLQRLLDQRLRPLEAMPGRLSGVENSLAALQGISGGLRDTWLLAETEYYLQIANAQLQLANNPGLARIALDLADERLATLGNPALTDVRRVIADEMRRLDGMVDIDTEGAALTLASLAATVQSLSLKTDMVEPDFSDPTVDPDLTGVDRAMAALKSSLSDVISVRRSDQPVKPLLPPDAAYFLRSNLTLQLQTARLALLRGEQALFDQSLGDAASWIAEYYEPDSTAVKSALETIDELRQTRFRQEAPDISGSLALLRQYMARQSRERRPLPPAADDAGNEQ